MSELCGHSDAEYELYHSLLADLVAETDRDKRRLGIDQRYYTGKLWLDTYGALGFIPGSDEVMRCWDFMTTLRARAVAQILPP